MLGQATRRCLRLPRLSEMFDVKGWSLSFLTFGSS
jgi:hypothetical protein